MINYLDDRRGVSVSSQELAEVGGLSRTRFYESFKAMTGLAPNQYASMLRIEHAVVLLTRTEMSFSDIAFELAFDSHANFTRFLRTTTGMTPKEFRRACVTLAPSNEERIA